jgi:hypothetical protein
VKDQNGRHMRLRHTATGALATLAAVSAIAGTAALAAKPRANAHGHAAMANGRATKTGPDPYAVAPAEPGKTPGAPVPGKGHAPQPGSSQPFLDAIQQLVENGTITPTEGQAVDREILVGRVDTDRLAASGFTQTQLQAVQQALVNTKLALAPAAPAAGTGKNKTPQQGTKAPGS